MMKMKNNNLTMNKIKNNFRKKLDLNLTAMMV